MASQRQRSIHGAASRPRSVPGRQPLAAAVAVVAGATRGAGRGIARALGEAGATVYCTGRSVRGNPSPYKRPETVEETAWKTDLKNAEAAFRQSLVSHIITAKYAAPYMIRQHRGLIVEVTENDVLSAGGNPVTQTVKLALKGLALNMAAELRPHGVAAVSITPGFLRSETMLERFGVREENWRDGGKKDKNFLESESPLFVGRAVVALAGDPAILECSGQLFSSWELGRQYRFTDADGRRPDWGAIEIDE